MRLLFLVVWAAAALSAAPHWKLQYFYDEDNSSLSINDLQFSSPERGVACGFFKEKEGSRTRPAAIVTSDGGKTWSVVRLRETCLSLFFLNDSLGWMVAPNGIWFTEEAGRSWRKLASLRGALRVAFLDEKKGFAVGARKSIWSTEDGGREWKRVQIPDEPKSNPDHTAYTWIWFADARDGMIVGASRPPRPGGSRFPDWMDPSAARKRRQWPSLSLVLDTRDGGTTWRASATSTFGQITRVRIAPDRRGLALVEFHDAFDWPAEVHRIDTRTGKSLRVFRATNRAVTDVLLINHGPGYLAAIEPPGMIRDLPIPGKLRILSSSDLLSWTEMPVDYRAEGRRAILAAAGESNVWAATDAGMILKLVPQ